MRKETLIKLGCLGALVAAPLVFEGCAQTASKSSVSENVKPVLTPVATPIEGKTDSPSTLHIIRTIDHKVANFLITRKSADSFIISDVTPKDSYLDTSINSATLPAAITFMRDNGCICGDTNSFEKGVNYQINVTNPENCLPQIK